MPHATLPRRTAQRGRLVLGCAGIALLVLAWFGYRLTAAHVYGVTVAGGDGGVTSVTFPCSSAIPANQSAEFRFHIVRTWLSQTSVVFVPDDRVVRISVNGAAVPLSGVDPKSLADYRRGFRFPLGRYLSSGDNQVAVVVHNEGGPGGLDVRPDQEDWRATAACFVAIAGFSALLALVLSSAGWGPPLIALAIGAAGLRVAYLVVTPYAVRDHDVTGHIEYIRYLLDHHALPRAADGYSFYHPPLYFVVGALQWAALAAVGTERSGILLSLQVQSLAGELGFALFGVATAQIWLDRLPPTAFGRGLVSRRGLEALAASLILLWPSGVVHAARIGNDDLTYLFIGSGMYFASRWWLVGGDRNANLAALSAALGVLTKTNSLLVFVVLVGVLLARCRSRWPVPVKQTLKRAAPALLLAALSTGVALGRSAIETLAGRQKDVLIANVASNSARLAVGNGAKNYLWFDAHTFVTQPFMNPWEDASGRQFFWNYLLKTSLFGEFQYESTWARNLAVLLSALLLGMGAFVVAATLVRSASEWLDELPLVLMVGIFVASLAAVRMRVPSACSGDFRYILPVVAPLSWWYVRGLARCTKRGWRNAALMASVTGWTFVVASVAFIVAVVVRESS